MKKLYGTGVALVTPFSESLEVDYKALKRLLTYTAKGVDYYVVMGTTGESATCTEEEKASVLAFVKANNTAKLPIVYGIGGNNTREVTDAIRHADLDGVDALLSVSPYYNKPSQEGIIRHFEAIADVSPVPVLLYNIPGRTASNLTAETTLRLAGHSNIIGTKEASGILEQCQRIMRNKPRDFMLISGDDMMAAALYGMGGKGVISVLANAYPVLFRRVKTYALERNIEKASNTLSALLDINGPMYEEGNPVGVKYLLSRMGICEPYVRLPLVPATDPLRAKIERLSAAIKK